MSTSAKLPNYHVQSRLLAGVVAQASVYVRQPYRISLLTRQLHIYINLAITRFLHPYKSHWQYIRHKRHMQDA
jgi:hypothetical protein